MNKEKLRSKIHLYGVHPTAAGLNKLMEAIEGYAEQEISSSTEAKRASTNCSDILSGPYWERRRKL